MSASKCEEDVDFVLFAADLSLLITISAVVTVSFVVDDILLEADGGCVAAVFLFHHLR